MLENNESGLSEYTNASIIQPVKQQLYDFTSRSQRLTFQSFQQNKLKNENSVSIRLSQRRHWKPKMPSKKLFQQPKFLLSLQRKKIRVIAGLKSSVDQAAIQNNNHFHSQKIKTNRVHLLKTEKKPIQGKSGLFELQGNDQTFHKNFRTPHLNFNLQYLIKKRKTFKSQSQQKKQGSNAPYFSFFSSNKFDFTQRHSSECSSRKSQSKTAQPFFRSKTKK